MLAAGQDSQLIHLPVLSPAVETTDRTASFQLSENGTLTGNVTVERTGALAGDLRFSLARDSELDQRQSVEESLQQDFSAFTLGTEKAENIQSLEKPLTLDYQLTAPMYARTAGGCCWCVRGWLAATRGTCWTSRGSIPSALPGWKR